MSPYPKNRVGDRAGMRDRSSRAEWKARARAAQAKPDEPLGTISAGSVPGKPPLCWCGEPCGHDWPGKDDRAPHPR